MYDSVTDLISRVAVILIVTFCVISVAHGLCHFSFSLDCVVHKVLISLYIYVNKSLFLLYKHFLT